MEHGIQHHCLSRCVSGQGHFAEWLIACDSRLPLNIRVLGFNIRIRGVLGRSIVACCSVGGSRLNLARAPHCWLRCCPYCLPLLLQHRSAR